MLQITQLVSTISNEIIDWPFEIVLSHCIVIGQVRFINHKYAVLRRKNGISFKHIFCPIQMFFLFIRKCIEATINRYVDGVCFEASNLLDLTIIDCPNQCATRFFKCCLFQFFEMVIVFSFYFRCMQLAGSWQGLFWHESNAPVQNLIL